MQKSSAICKTAYGYCWHLVAGQPIVGPSNSTVGTFLSTQ